MNWWSRLFGLRRMEEQLEKELRFHLDHRISDLIARGYTPDEARRQARLALGGLEQVKEECRDARGTRWLEDVAKDTRHSFRTFRQKPGFAAIAVLILALGIGATTVMFAVVNGVLLKPLAFPGSDRLVTVHGYTEQLGDFWGMSNPDLDDLRGKSRTLTIAAWTYGGGTISEPGEPEYVNGRKISAELLPTLGIVPLHGRTFRRDEDRPGAEPVAIISHALWQRRFSGDPAAVGRTFVFEDRTYVIAGVTPAGFQLSGDADVFTMLGQSRDPRVRNRSARFNHIVARLRPEATFADAQSEIAVIANQLAKEYPKSNEGITMRVHPLQQELVGDVGATLWLLLSAVGVLLLLACVNIASLFLTRAVSREREFAMRVALGAGRGRLARQCLTESGVVSICGGLAGILFATVSLRPFVAFWPGRLAPRRGDSARLVRTLVWNRSVSLMRPLVRDRSRAARSITQPGTGAPRRRAHSRWNFTASA